MLNKIDAESDIIIEINAKGKDAYLITEERKKLFKTKVCVLNLILY